MAIPQDVRNDVIKRLQSTYEFRKVGDWFRTGVCPSCNKKELYSHAVEPWAVRCGRTNKCGWESNVKELYPDAFENFNERYQPTQQKPNATAEAYMDFCRGFPIDKTKGWYRQGKYWNRNAVGKNQGTATVLFDIDREKDISMERFVETLHIKDPTDDSVKSQKAHFSGKYRGLWWIPPSIDVTKIGELWLVEGCIDAMALTLSNIPAAANLSSTNYPEQMLDALPKTVKLVWALDNDESGKKYIKRHIKKAKEAGFECDAALIPSKGKDKLDWNDAYQKGWLDSPQRIETYRYHGALLLAANAFEKALLTWNRFGRNDFAVEFGRKIYWFSIDFEKFGKEMDSLRESGTDEKELRLKAAKICGAIHEIANCRFEFLYFLTSRLTDESWYYARVEFPHGRHPIKNTFTGGMVASASEFKKRLLSIAPGALFSGRANQLDWIVKNYLDNIKIVETVDFIGYAKEHKTYIFNQMAISKGIEYTLNDEDFFEVDKLSLKSLNQSLQLQIGTEQDYDLKWVDHLWDAFGPRGIIAVAFFFGSLFAEQIRTAQKSYPFIEIVGTAGSGKTTLLEFLWKLLGRDDYEGFDPNKATLAARSRIFSQTSNLPVALIESDREDSAKQRQFDWDELKTAYNGRASRARGVKNSGNDTDEPPFRGSILISQNEQVDGSEAIMTRIIHTHFDTSHHTDTSKEAADTLAAIPVEKVSHFMVKACKAEKQIMETVIAKTKEFEKNISKNTEIKSMRIAKNHGQLMALVEAMAPLIKLPDARKKEVQEAIINAAVDRQKAIAADHPIVRDFWEAFDYMNHEDKLNHSRKAEYISINLNQVQQWAFTNHQSIPPITDLKKHLKLSVARKFKGIKAVNSKNEYDEGFQFTGSKTIKCWVFEREGTQAT